jgi:hypothetical protein
MKRLLVLLAACACALLVDPGLVGSEEAGRGGKGKGHGKGAGQDRDFQGIIHELFAAHDRVDRAVELTESGYRAKTTSKDAKVAG